MNYKNLYQQFISSRPKRVNQRQKGYHLHHILPRSLGGNNDTDNLISLTPREHFIAHRLLVKCYTGGHRVRMIKSLYWFEQVAKTSRLYEHIKKHYYNNLEYRKALRLTTKKGWTDARRKAKSEQMRKQWQDPSKRAKTIAGLNSVETREKNRQSALRYWQDPKHIVKVKEGHKRAGTGSWMTSDQARRNRLSL